MSEGEYVTVAEAASLLGVQKEKIRRLVLQGVLTSHPSVLDARRRLIPRRQVEQIHEGESYNPPRRRKVDETAVENHTVPQISRGLRPRSIGIVSDGSLQSENFEDYMLEHWRPK